jgi:hypothetical protein
MTRMVFLCALLAAGPVAAQQPRVGLVDTYGGRTLSADQLRRAARINAGDSITNSIAVEAEARLLALPNVAEAHVDVVCCENGRSIVYLGVRERGDTVAEFFTAPEGDARLPNNVLQAERDFMRALGEAVRSGQTEENDSLGHSLMRFPAARAAQQRFLQYAAGNVATLRAVLQTSAIAEQRALAAQVMAYAANKHAVIPDLVRALRDPDADVRNNATRALGVMAMYAQRHPEAILRIPHEPFIAMLNSPIWTDRNKSSFVLMSLTDARDPVLLAELRRKALPALSDMVRWQSIGHAFPAAVILGRMAGLPDAEIMAAFNKDRAKLIEAARAPK